MFLYGGLGSVLVSVWWIGVCLACVCMLFSVRNYVVNRARLMMVESSTVSLCV